MYLADACKNLSEAIASITSCMYVDNVGPKSRSVESLHSLWPQLTVLALAHQNPLVKLEKESIEIARVEQPTLARELHISSCRSQSLRQR